MTGMDRETGKPLGGTAHLQQSLRDILSTLLGTRVGRREYGSLVPEMVDQPGNALGRQRLIAAIVAAIARWEPRLRLTRVGFSAAGADGTFTVELEGDRTDVPAATDPSRFTVPLQLLPV
jgi:phage baseplate assembly protein W